MIRTIILIINITATNYNHNQNNNDDDHNFNNNNATDRVKLNHKIIMIIKQYINSDRNEDHPNCNSSDHNNNKKQKQR